jgi:hypothetical protein
MVQVLMLGVVLCWKLSSALDTIPLSSENPTQKS